MGAFIQSPGRRRGLPVFAGRCPLAGWSATHGGVAEDDRQPEAQFPAPRGDFEDPPERLERLPPPGKRGRELMTAHLRDRHGIQPFTVERHVHLGGKRTETQHLTWDAGKASFHCDLCPGVSFGTGEITDEMVEIALLFNENLQPHLAGLTEPGDREEMARRYLAGDLNRERLRQLRGGDARRRSATGARPSVEGRRARLQPWLLARVRERGVLERVLDEAEKMQRNDAAAWAELCDRTLSRETLRDYWQDIDPDERAAASAAGRAHAKKST